MTKCFWHPKTFHRINLQNEPNKGGRNFVDLELEINAYFLETINTAINHKDRQWVGMLIYRLGRPLAEVLEIGGRKVKYAEKQSANSSTILRAYTKFLGKIKDWRKADFKSIKRQ